MVLVVSLSEWILIVVVDWQHNLRLLRLLDGQYGGGQVVLLAAVLLRLRLCVRVLELIVLGRVRRVYLLD